MSDNTDLKIENATEMTRLVVLVENLSKKFDEFLPSHKALEERVRQLELEQAKNGDVKKDVEQSKKFMWFVFGTGILGTGANLLSSLMGG